MPIPVATHRQSPTKTILKDGSPACKWMPLRQVNTGNLRQAWLSSTAVVQYFLQGQVEHLALPFIRRAVFGQQQDVLYGTTDRSGTADLDETGHGKPSFYPLIGIARHRSNVMSEEHTTFLSGPFEYNRIAGASKTNILDEDNVESRVSS